jgi:arsenite methyltransferase
MALTKDKNNAAKAPRGGASQTGVEIPGLGDGGSLDVKEAVKKYYGKVLQASSDLKTNACCTAETPPALLREALAKVPQEIVSRYYGCGSPLPFGIEGLDVVDLGSGSGRDCYVSAALVGPKGTVVGVDMTPEQLDVARGHIDEYCQSLGYAEPNLSFQEGYIEFLEDAGIAPNSKDLVISNCVVNLSPDKRRVLQGVWDSLREGGEFYFSDVYCDRRLSDEVRAHEVLFGECLGGALYTEDFIRLCHSIGFADPRMMSQTAITIEHQELQNVVGEAKFYSITYRLFKLSNLETLCEDYGQVVYYKGTIVGHPHSYVLDDHHKIETGKAFPVCGNSASMLCDSWLGEHFELVGDRSRHFGLFDCSDDSSTAATTDGGCC